MKAICHKQDLQRQFCSVATHIWRIWWIWTFWWGVWIWIWRSRHQLLSYFCCSHGRRRRHLPALVCSSESRSSLLLIVLCQRDKDCKVDRECRKQRCGEQRTQWLQMRMISACWLGPSLCKGTPAPGTPDAPKNSSGFNSQPVACSLIRLITQHTRRLIPFTQQSIPLFLLGCPLLAHPLLVYLLHYPLIYFKFTFII